MDGAESTNYVKFQTANPVVRHMIDGLYSTVGEIAAPLRADSLLDAGCGEGETLARLADRLPDRTEAVDVSAAAAELTRRRCPDIEVRVESIEALPYPEDSFDLVLCLEVLEHIPRPEGALVELERVCARDLIVSVPDEPWFRLGSLLRGKYLAGFGNHPEHVNHWRPATLREFLGTRFEVASVRRSFPWLVAHCRTRLGSPDAKPTVRSI